MITRRTVLFALACSALTSGCSKKNDLVEDTQAVRDRLIEKVGADTEVYSVDLGSANKTGAGVTIATVRFKDGDDIKLQAVMLWGPPSAPATDDEPRPDDPATPVRVADIDFSEVAANVEASLPMLPESHSFMSVSSYRLPIGQDATWQLAAGFIKSASSARTEVEYALFSFGRSPSGDVVALP